jgi:2-polyprenyl-3-methyl-5-hydroxy-6-metoxy-1,4-benzoquinol methylase
MDKSEKFWDRIASSFDKDEKSLEVIHTKTIENTLKFVKASDEVLDYGCATGTKTFELAGKVKKIHAIDISSKMIEIAKKRAVKKKVENIEFTHATIFDENLKRGSFDVITAFNILHALENHEEVLERIAQLLKPDGLFISITPCLREKIKLLTRIQFNFFLLLIKIGFMPNILTRFKINELEDLITNKHFQVTFSEKIHHKLLGYFIVAKKKKVKF